jgi:serine/threonine protein kinase
MPENETDLRKKVQDVWGSTLSGVELPGQSIKPAAARQTMAAPGAEPVRLPTVPLGTPKGETPARAAQIEILDVIGEGGMGTIYRARQVSLEREVALKRIKPHLEMRQDVVDMFLGEAHATGALDHPNIVPVYELGRDDKGQAFYSMKLVHGTPWNKLLHPETDEQRVRADAMSVRDHLDILLKVSDAIGFAHSRGVIHRDLKPENVMVGEFGEVLVMDWGLAATAEPGLPATRRLPDVTKVSVACGTPSYMPPEMALGEGFRTCPASDVYLLGAILFEILFGKPPHQGETVWAVLLAASENRIAKPEKAPPEGAVAFRLGGDGDRRARADWRTHRRSNGREARARTEAVRRLRRVGGGIEAISPFVAGEPPRGEVARRSACRIRAARARHERLRARSGADRTGRHGE